MGNNNSKSATAQEFLNTKFSSRPSKRYEIAATCRQSGWALSKRATDKASGEAVIAEYWNKVWSRSEVEYLARVYQTFQRTNHPNLVKLRNVYRLSKANYVFVTNYYQNMDLFDIILSKTGTAQMSESDAVKYTFQLLQALQYLHQLEIAHRDIKPEWIYFQDTDCSKILLHPGPFCTEPGNSSDLNQFCGTLSYLAPEIANRQVYSKAVDCWSLGVTVFVMLSGGLPFVAQSESETLQLIQKGEYELENWKSRSKEARDFVQRLMSVDIEQRMTCEQALQHPWIASQT